MNDVQEILQVAHGPTESVRLSLAIASAMGLYHGTWIEWRIRLFMAWSVTEYVGGQLQFQSEKARRVQLFAHLGTLHMAMLLVGTTPHDILASLILLAYTFLHTFYVLVSFAMFWALGDPVLLFRLSSRH